MCDAMLVVSLTCDLTRSIIGASMMDLANTYNSLGRYEDALMMQNKTLELLRRYVPEGHESLGEALRLFH